MRAFRNLILLAVMAAALVAGAKEFIMPRAAAAGAYPAHDDHAAEHVVIAVDPYDTQEKAAIFKVKWREHDLLPVFFVVTNSGEQPIALTNMKVEWVTAHHSKLQPASDEEIARRLNHLKHRGDEMPRVPLPLPHKGPRLGVPKDAAEELDRAEFEAVAVEPHSTHSGFLFFDVSAIEEPIAGARVYVTGVQGGDGKELLFFEIPLDDYLGGAKAK